MGRTRRISLITARLDSSSFLGSSDASATLAMDSLLGTTLRPDDRDAGFAEYTLYTLVYLLALGCLLAAMLGASPLAVGWKHAQKRMTKRREQGSSPRFPCSSVPPPRMSLHLCGT